MILKRLFVYPKFPESLEKLQKLAYNIWCTWNYDAIRLFYRIDAELWRTVNHNPVQFLLSLPKERLDELAADRGFLFELENVWEQFQRYTDYDAQFHTPRSGHLPPEDLVAYFSMEFGLHECIPIYGGGLGILAGDVLKAASDLNLPLVGVGLVYKLGYFNQRISVEGQQEELYLEFDNHQVPIRELHAPQGGKARITMQMRDHDLHVQLWQIDVGKIRLILLDTDLEENPPELRDITNELYVGDRPKRLQQEIVLGIGGVRALESLGIEPRIYHCNEGHSAFMVIARLQRLMREQRLSFEEAKAVIRASTVFTTHTPVIAGNERFETDLVEEYITPELESVGLSFDELASHGEMNHEKKVFWLPALAIRFAQQINAVSKMHGDVSRRMWAGLFPERPEVELPVGYVTNGVHCSWLSQPVVEMLNRHIGPDYERRPYDEAIREKMLAIDEEEVWQAHHRNKQSLITYVRKKLADDLGKRGYIESRILKLTRALNPEFLTIVFARRFASYKRATLILRDKDRLAKILSNSTKPVQLLFAGKAHPADGIGKGMIKEIIDFAKAYQLEDRVMFIENYDMNVARHLAWGADVWLNNPIRENEASGTSGMKAAMNGVLNLSVPDGWWPEAYNGRNGWIITGGDYHNQFEMRQAAEAAQIYDLIEQEITELFYDRNEAGVPVHWVQMMKESISSVCCQFNMNRVLTDYVDRLYVPAKLAVETLSRDNYESVRQALAQGREVLSHWDKIAIGRFATSVDRKEVVTEGERVSVTCSVDLAGASPELFQVELFCAMQDQDTFQVVPMHAAGAGSQPAVYGCDLDIAGRGLASLNARIRPSAPIVQDLYPELVKWAQ